MTPVHCRGMAAYHGTPFGVLELRGYHPQPDGMRRFAAEGERMLAALRSRHAGRDRRALIGTDPVLAAYAAYYKRFKKTYHVQAQIESALGGRGLPAAGGLVQVLLLTELTTSLLIAGLDADTLSPPLALTAAEGGETYLAAGGREVVVKPGDICLTDQGGVAVSIIYGQNARSRMTDATTNALFLIDAVPGIDCAAVERGLHALADLLRLQCPAVELVQGTVVEAAA